MRLKVINADAATQQIKADMIVTDPPFEMDGKKLADILSNYDADHLLLICSMRQVLELYKYADHWKLSFQLVMELCVPNRPIHYHLPAYTHCLVCYFTKGKAKSKFNRKGCLRADTHEPSYFPSIIHAPRERRTEHGHAKNQQALKDVLACFDVKSIVDPFAGSGTTGLVCNDLNIDCTMIEMDKANCDLIAKSLRFFGIEYEC